MTEHINSEKINTLVATMTDKLGIIIAQVQPKAELEDIVVPQVQVYEMTMPCKHKAYELRFLVTDRSHERAAVLFNALVEAKKETKRDPMLDVIDFLLSDFNPKERE